MSTPTPSTRNPERAPRERRGPLAGVRVCDFCWMGVGSVATRLLGDFGAEVVKIETRTRLDLPRRLPIYKGDEQRTFGEEDPDPDPDKGGLFNNYCRNKLSATIDLRHERGRQLAERLIARSSVVTENFAPGVMERWGFTYERLRELRPDVIYARMSGYGHSGPHSDFRSYGPVVQAVSGLSHISGLPGREPSGWGLSYMDNMAAYYASSALLMAVLHREATGEGTEIDVSAVEVGVGLVGPLLLDVAVNGRSTRRPDFPPGNRLEHPAAAPHGVYPCRGDDRWVAIAVFDDVQWRALVDVLGRPDWASDPALATTAGRSEAQAELDVAVAAWTAGRDRHEVMAQLQAVGVPAGAVQDARDVNERDPQVAAHDLFFDLDHPVIGRARFEGVPFRASTFAPDHWRSAPLLGEDSEYVFRDVCGLDDQEWEELVASGVIET